MLQLIKSLPTTSSILHCLSKSGMSALVCFSFISIAKTGLRPNITSNSKYSEDSCLDRKKAVNIKTVC